MEALNNTPVQEDYSGVLLEVANSLDSYSSQYLRDNIKKNVSIGITLLMLFNISLFMTDETALLF